jgi:hypothetical protein
MIVPSVATTPLQQLTNRATVRDDLGRNATGTAQVVADVPAPPNSVSVVLRVLRLWHKALQVQTI